MVELFEPRQTLPFWTVRGTTAKYALTVVAVIIAGLVRWLFDPLVGNSNFFFTFLVAVVFAAWIGGWRTALLSTILGTLAAWFFFIPPRYAFASISAHHGLGIMIYLFICLLFNLFGEAMRLAREQAKAQADLLRITLASIGDAVISTDARGAVTFLNPVAERLTGWTSEQARGQPLEEVFRIVNETTRQPVENPAHRALRFGTIVGLANHTILISRTGMEWSIDDSAAPIRNEEEDVVGSVLIFRDITERRKLERENSEQMRAASFLASIVQSSEDPILSKSLNGIIQSWNSAAERLFGYMAEETVGQHISMLIPPERLSEEEQILARLRAGERIEHFDTVRITKSGRPVHVSLTISPMKDAAGQIVGASKIVRDITQRMEAEERERQLIRASADANAKFRAVFDQSSVFAGVMTLDGILIDANQLSLESCGYTADEVLSKRFWETPWWRESPDIQAKIQAGARQAAQGIIYREVLPYRVADGTLRVVDFALYPIRDASGQVIFLHPTGIDITERQRMENELRRVAAELSEANRRKDEFLATLAHELRNPLAPIRNGLQILQMAGSRDDTIAETRGMMERQLNQMVRLVDDLMDVSRISRGRLELRRTKVTLDDILQNAIEANRPIVQDLGHQLIVRLPEPPVLIDADPTRIAQVFLNLLNNAAKYSPEGSVIHLTGERQESEVVVSIRDRGIGIAADQLSRIFEMFSQIDHSLEKARGGLGIGLTLVRRIVELHGGTVEARSDGPDRGSEFIVRLPVAEPSSSSPTESAVAVVKTQLRVLIVDDNQDSAKTLSMMIKLFGNETRMAYDGEEAVAAAAEFQPDVILLDIGLPKLNGYEVCRRIREQPHGKDVYIIAQTGWGQDEDRQRTKDAGFDCHLVKPVDSTQLMKILADLSPSQPS